MPEPARITASMVPFPRKTYFELMYIHQDEVRRLRYPAHLGQGESSGGALRGSIPERKPCEGETHTELPGREGSALVRPRLPGPGLPNLGVSEL